MGSRRLMPLVALTVAVTSALTACGDSSTTLSGNLGTAANASFKLPYRALSDWVSYSDQYSVFTVLSEEQIPPPPEVFERGEGYVGRSVTVRIEDTPWRADGSPAIDGELSMVVAGWTMRDGRLSPAALGGIERLEVGKRYMAPLVLFEDDDGDDWGPNGPAVLRLEGGVVATPDINPRSVAPPVVLSMIGKTADEVVALMATTEPDPLAVKYSHLRPEERWQAVLAERRAATGNE